MLNRKTKNESSSPYPEGASEFETMASPVSEVNLSIGETGLVYIVDDEPEILNILTQALEAAGMTVSAFTSPKKMLEDLNRHVPDLVITDMKMDGLDGIDVLHSIKSANPEIPVVILSGHLEKDSLLELIEGGAFGALEKPFDLNAILEMSVSAVRQNQMRKIANRSISMILYHFADLKEHLSSEGRSDLVFSIESELKFFLEQKKAFWTSKRPRI